MYNEIHVLPMWYNINWLYGDKTFKKRDTLLHIFPYLENIIQISYQINVWIQVVLNGLETYTCFLNFQGLLNDL